jgi:hypothetical protein
MEVGEQITPQATNNDAITPLFVFMREEVKEASTRK